MGSTPAVRTLTLLARLGRGRGRLSDQATFV